MIEVFAGVAVLTSVATQLADETLFLVNPKKELESKFLVDRVASVRRRKRTR